MKLPLRNVLIAETTPRCPQCEGIELRRQGRVGFLQTTVLPRFGYFPWECGLCRKIYFVQQRSTAASQSWDTASSAPEETSTALRVPFPPVAALQRSLFTPVFEKERVS